MRSRKAIVLVAAVLAVLAIVLQRALDERATTGTPLAAPGAVDDRSTSARDTGRADASGSSAVAEPPGDAARSSGGSNAPTPIDTSSRLRGVVVDPRGQPIAGARVELLKSSAATYDYLSSDDDDAPVLVAESTTPADGRFEHELARARPFVLRASAPSFASTTIDGVHAGEFVRVELASSASIEGIVTRASDHAPVEGAKILLHDESGNEALRETSTDPGGRYRFERVSSGSKMIQVLPVLEILENRTLELAPGERRILDVDVRAGALVRGTVVDARTRTPIAGAEVSFLDFRGKTGRTDLAGEYRIGGFWLGRASRNLPRAVRARAHGYADAVVMVVPEALDDHVADFELERAIVATGRIVDATGAPVVKAWVGLIGIELGAEAAPDEALATRTSGDGRFEISGLSSTRRYTLFARKEALASKCYDVVPLAAGAERIDLGDFALARGGSIEGDVVDERGGAIPGAIVEMFGANDDRTARTGEKRGWFGGAVDTRASHSDSLGRFAFTDVPAGTFRLRAYVEGLPPLENVSVKLFEGETRAGVKLVLQRALAIEGVVLDPDGAPIADATVTATSEAGAKPIFSRTSSDERGRFRVGGIVEGAYTIDAVRASRSLLPRTPPALAHGVERRVAAGSTNVIVRLAEAVHIEGVVRTSDGTAAPRVAFVAVAEDGTRFDRCATDALGRFALDVPGDRRIDVRVFAAGAGEGSGAAIHTFEAMQAGAWEIVLRTGTTWSVEHAEQH